MTREDAIEVLEKMKYPQKVNKNGFIISNVNIENEALEMAIKTLSQEPTEKPMTVDEMEREYEKSKALFHKIVECEDAISREWLMRKATERFYTTNYFNHISAMIEEAPSVTQKSGKWIEHPEIETSAPEYLMFYECSECGDKQCFCKSDIHKKRFCNNCGAKMVEPQESEE